ncbi:MAG TPA: sulfotransferase [Actinomycetota bacterium]|jgi:hypothetical protein
MVDARMPDVVIIGAMKSATTTLYRWLDEQPEVFVARSKETRFFTDHWSRGPDWYAGLFAQAQAGQLLGESSVNYTNPRLAPVAADRMAQTIPQVRVIYILRHPVERIRSHYRHEVQRRREERTFVEAVREPGNPYIGHSMYFTCLQPYIERFSREQILVIRFEDLVRPPSPAWTTVLGFLSLDEREAPESAHNVGSEKAQWTRTMAWAKRHRLISLRQVSRMPKSVRRAGRFVFAREGRDYRAKLDGSRAPLDPEVLDGMWADVARLEEWMGTELWERDDQSLSRGPAG